MPELKQYSVINRPLVESLARQLGLPVDQERTVEGQIGVNGGKVGAGVKTGRKQAPLPPDDPRLLPPIVSSLRDSGQLRVFRPERAEEFWAEESDWYVHENTTATPVLVPLDKTLRDRRTPEALTVWIIDPVESTAVPRDEWDWIGSFVFIVQELGNFPWPTPYFISGISALRLVVDVIAKMDHLDEDELTALSGDEDLFGRWHDGHPVEKLERAGGISLRPRKIDTIYKIAYMSNEQSLTVNGRQTRTNDILAYPLYIAE